MPAPTTSPDTSPSHWLLAAATVALAHGGMLYAVWDGSGSGPGTPPAEQVTEVQLVPATPITMAAAAPLPPPQTAHRQPTAAQRPATPAATGTQASDLSPEPPANSAAADTPATAAEPPPAAEPFPASEPQTVARNAPAASLPLPAFAPPPSSQWHYEIRGESKGLTYTAHATLHWRQDGQHYEARMEMSAFLIGSRVQTSVGTLGANGLQPAEFTDRARKQRRLVFDHEAHLIRLDGSDATAPLAQGVQDRLSLFMQLSSVLAGLPHPPAKNHEWTVAVAGSPAADSWTFRYLQTETLPLPAGRYEAWHLQRQPRREGDQQVDLWFAPTLHHLPVRIRIQQDNGDVVDQQLSPG